MEAASPDLFAWIEGLPPSAFLRQNVVAYILVNAGHILGIGLLVGAILPLDLRLTGVVRRGALAELTPFLVRAAAVGLVVAIVSGLLLFSVKPGEYAGNSAFLLKLCLLALGLVTVALQHFGASWRAVLGGAEPALRHRLLALVSSAIWIAAIIAGRWIGFV